MECLNKYKIAIISIVALIIMLLGVLVWNKIIIEQNKEKEMTPISEPIDVSDVNNISSVEEKFGQPMKITQNYLLKYTTNKSGVWYMSKALVKNISYDGDNAIITFISEDEEYSIKGTIAKDKVDFKKGDLVNFVGSVEFSNRSLNLSNVSKNDIGYKDVSMINFNDLVISIDKALNNQFIISGYMVTDGSKYKLFESKNSYNKNDSVGNYFTLVWKDDFNYTGNANVTVQCYIGDTYKLINCEMMQ